MKITNLGDQLQGLNLKAIASISATGLSSAIDLQDYEGEILVAVDVANVSGTTPTLDFKLTEASTSGGSYTDVASGGGTQVTTVASFQTISLNSDSMKQFVKLSYTLAGTDPVYLLSAKIYGMKKNPA